MKKTIILLVSLFSIPLYAQNLQTGDAKPIYFSTKVPVALYGFVSAETAYSDSQVSSFGTLDNTPASYNRNIIGFNRVVDKNTAVNRDPFLSWTVQNSRFGFLLSPYNFDNKKFEVDARFEMDFANVSENGVGSIRPRIRRLYAAIGQKSWRLLFGQEWDIFSPLNTATLNISGNLWLQGNLGFRHPQIAFTYNHELDEKSKLEGAVSAGLPSNSMATDDAGNITGVPMLQGRVGYLRKVKAGDMKLYLSSIFARHVNATAGSSQISNWGVALSADLPVHKYIKPSFEMQYSYSLGNMFSLASDTTKQRDIAGWGQVKSCWAKWLETNIGYGVDSLKGSQVAANWVKLNQVGFVNFQFKPVDAFIIGLEYNHMMTNYQGSGTSMANVGLLNTMYIF